MIFKSINKFPRVNIGDSVRMSIPEVDRNKGDPRNIIFVIINIDKNKNYKLGNKNGTLTQLYSRNEFTVCPKPLINVEDVSDQLKSLREVANLQSLTGGQIFKKRLCKSDCKNKKCKCKSLNLLCNSRCHNSLTCNNK
jgi:hypothetical protein